MTLTNKMKQSVLWIYSSRKKEKWLSKRTVCNFSQILYIYETQITLCTKWNTVLASSMRHSLVPLETFMAAGMAQSV